MSAKRPITVTDHAVLRYLERVGGFEIEALRREIARRISEAAPEGASAIVIEGHRFILREDAVQGRTVTTVLKADWSVSKEEKGQ